MAKNNNLTDFLTDIANAIRTKKGTAAKINPQDFSNEIASIEGGGAMATASVKDVNFRDYDGTCLYSYTKEEFLALSALPELPKQKGLICQGWNWSLSDAKEQVEYSKHLDIGANYVTDDGKTRLYIELDSESLNVTLNYYLDGSTQTVIDWGDSVIEEIGLSYGKRSKSHTYESAGNYIISIDTNIRSFTLGSNSSTPSVFGGTSNNEVINNVILKKVEFGSGVSDLGYAPFWFCIALETVTIPNTITKIGQMTWRCCYSLKYIVVPSSVTSTAGSWSFGYCYALKGISLPKGITDFGGSNFYYCYNLNKIIIPDGVTQLSESMFRYNYALRSIVIPNSVTSIANSVFDSCYGLRLVDCSKYSIVPTLGSGVFAYTSSDLKIVVPDALYDEWIAATNWSAYASKIVKESEFNG